MKWKFETLSKDYSFEIEAEDYKQAFKIAYEAYGPQVEDMVYYQINF